MSKVYVGDYILITEKHADHGLAPLVGSVGVVTHVSSFDIRFTINNCRSYYWMPLYDVIHATELVKALS